MLMTIQGEYLLKIYNQTNIQSSYIPAFKNGNLKYLSNETQPYIKEQLQKDDFGHVLPDRSRHTNFRMNMAGRFNQISRQHQHGITRRAPPKGQGQQAFDSEQNNGSVLNNTAAAEMAALRKKLEKMQN
jgi:hypothetical protein